MWGGGPMLVAMAMVFLVEGGWFEGPTPPPEAASWWNATLDELFQRTAELRGQMAATYQDYRSAVEVPPMDGWVWTILDTLFGLFGWAIFGNAWQGVRSGMAWLVRLGAFLVVCVAAHYVWALAWPVVSLCLGFLLGLRWLVKTAVRILGKLSKLAQQVAFRKQQGRTLPAQA